MRRVFISIPTEGRTDEAIRASYRKIIELEEESSGDTLQWINRYDPIIIPKNVKENNRELWQLGVMLKRLALADLFIGIRQDGSIRNCNLEEQTAKAFGIESFIMTEDLWREIMPDAWEIYSKGANEWRRR